jgi:pyruvate-ferredoxin/flavodoxin oxidoreductase
MKDHAAQVARCSVAEPADDVRMADAVERDRLVLKVFDERSFEIGVKVVLHQHVERLDHDLAVRRLRGRDRVARKKDLGMLAVAYGNVYVAQIAMGSNPAQAVRVFHEAESYPGPSLILAYSHCIAHGINMTTSMSHQKDVVQSGFWPLYHYDPRQAHAGQQPFHLDSREAKISFKDFAMQEGRFAMLARSNPEQAEILFALAQKDIDDQWHYYQQMAGVQREISSAAQETHS